MVSSFFILAKGSELTRHLNYSTPRELTSAVSISVRDVCLTAWTARVTFVLSRGLAMVWSDHPSLSSESLLLKPFFSLL